MKAIKLKLRLLALVSSFCLHPSALLHAQGSLTPPSAPGATMLTLSQVEPRTPVDAAHTGSGGSSEFLITQPGSYYLTTNVVGVSSLHGINISANNVTLDLNGFSLQGSSSAFDAIYIHAGYTNVTVRNGNISGWSNASSTYGFGVECYANNVILERLNVSANRYGIYLDSSGVVRDCNCHNNATNGIYVVTGKVSGCEALNNAANGVYVIAGTVSGCEVLNNAEIGIQVNAGNVSGCEALNNVATGIYVVAGTVSDCDTLTNDAAGIYVVAGTVSGCTANNNGLLGIYAGLATVSGCTANNNGFGDGIDASNNCTIKDCTASGNTYDGIFVETNCTVKDCTVSDNSNGYGIGVYGNDCQIAGNTCNDNYY